MRGQEGEDDPPLVPRLGTRTGSTLLFSTTTRFSDMKQKRNYSFLTSRSIAKTSYKTRSSGVLLQTGRVFLMTFIVGVKSYMEVSNETSDYYYKAHLLFSSLAFYLPSHVLPQTSILDRYVWQDKHHLTWSCPMFESFRPGTFGDFVCI